MVKEVTTETSYWMHRMIKIQQENSNAHILLEKSSKIVEIWRIHKKELLQFHDFVWMKFRTRAVWSTNHLGKVYQRLSKRFHNSKTRPVVEQLRKRQKNKTKFQQFYKDAVGSSMTENTEVKAICFIKKRRNGY